MNENIVLSICIPAYNGGKRIVANIMRMLKSTREDFEIIISDNVSTDGSMEALRDINDTRLRIYQNRKNIGSLENGIQALQYGEGKYLMLLLDRDILQLDFFDMYMDMLKNEQVGVILNMCQNINNVKDHILSKKESVFWITKAPHPSYYVFLREAFRNIKAVNELARDGYYPAYCGLAIRNDYDVLLYCENPIVMEAEWEYILMNASRSWKFEIDKHGLNNTKRDHGFEAQTNIRRFKNYVCYMKENLKDFGNSEIFQVYKSTLYAASPGNYYAAISTATRHRYHVVKGYTLEEYSHIPFNFYKEAEAFLRELELDDTDLLAEMKELTEQNYREFCELVYG